MAQTRSRRAGLLPPGQARFIAAHVRSPGVTKSGVVFRGVEGFNPDVSDLRDGALVPYKTARPSPERGSTQDGSPGGAGGILQISGLSVNDLRRKTNSLASRGGALLLSDRHGRERLLPSAPTSPLMTSPLSICGYKSLRAKVAETRPSRHLHCHFGVRPPCQAMPMELAVQPKMTSTSCWPRAPSD
jgi:hypothetical protein